MYEYVSSTGQLRLSPKAKFTFSSTKINGVRNYYNNHRYYWTFDISVHNQYDNNVSAIWAYTTNVPNPKFDIDDDPEPVGNGYNDETEVVCLSPLSLAAGTQYYYEPYYNVYYKAGSVFDWTSQESYYSSISGEYDTATYNGITLTDLLRQRLYPF